MPDASTFQKKKWQILSTGDSVVDAVMQYRQQDAHIFQTKNF